MIRHVVLWELNAEDAAQRAEDAAGIVERLGSLRGAIPGMSSLEVGVDVGDTDGNWHVMLVTLHESRDALAGYQSHPAHVAVAAAIRPLVARRASVDAEVAA
jgi:hypothetical protein